MRILRPEDGHGECAESEGEACLSTRTLSSSLPKHQKEMEEAASNTHTFHISVQWPQCSPIAQQWPLPLLPQSPNLGAEINPEGKEDTTSLHGQQYSSLQDVSWPPVPLGGQ
jgi:hypothetical protein